MSAKIIFKLKYLGFSLFELRQLSLKNMIDAFEFAVWVILQFSEMHLPEFLMKFDSAVVGSPEYPVVILLINFIYQILNFGV